MSEEVTTEDKLRKVLVVVKNDVAVAKRAMEQHNRHVPDCEITFGNTLNVLGKTLEEIDAALAE